MSFNMESLTPLQKTYIFSAALSSMTDVDWKCVLACSGPEFRSASRSVQWVSAIRFALANQQLSEERRFQIIANLWKTCCLSQSEKLLIIEIVAARDRAASKQDSCSSSYSFVYRYCN